MSGKRPATVAAALALLLTAAGCGGNHAAEPAAGAAVQEAGGGGMLAYALQAKPRSFDPLSASTHGAATVAAQLYEPLVASLNGPFGDVRRRRGLALSWRSTADREIWSFRLRPRVRFQDGSPFNASAVLANAVRWRSLPAGRRLLPDLVAADAPSPSEVRFVLNRPAPDLPSRLSVPQFGIVSPAALSPSSGDAARMTRTTNAGTGPFELRQNGAGEVVLARSDTWWGSRFGLGPALDQIRFRVVPSEAMRVSLLRHGEAQVVDGLGPRGAALLARDPLLYTIAVRGERLGLERSVRGIDPGATAKPFSDVWLTTVGTG